MTNVALSTVSFVRTRTVPSIEGWKTVRCPVALFTAQEANATRLNRATRPHHHTPEGNERRIRCGYALNSVSFFFLRGFLYSPIGGSGEGWRFYNRRRKGKFAARANCAVRARALKRVLLPTFGNPIKPTLGVTHNWVVVIVVELVQEEERARDTEKASEPPSCPLCVVWLLVE